MIETIVETVAQRDWVDFERPLFLSGPSELERSLESYGLDGGAVQREELIIEPGAPVVLSEVVRPHHLTTPDVSVFKAWIGTPDELIESHPFAGLPELPGRPWAAGGAATPGTLLPGEEEDIQKAVKAYLFGCSQWVESYKEAIELFYGPFAADLYAVRRLVVKPGGSLLVQGRPTALLCERVEVHAGGSVKLFTVTRMKVGSMLKLEAQL